ncbi:MAG: hypothetical protein C4338_00955 [Rhodanobacteraceae bacterium]
MPMMLFNTIVTTENIVSYANVGTSGFAALPSLASRSPARSPTVQESRNYAMQLRGMRLRSYTVQI